MFISYYNYNNSCQAEELPSTMVNCIPWVSHGDLRHPLDRILNFAFSDDDFWFSDYLDKIRLFR